VIWIVGLDLSLRRTAWVAVPLSWRRDWGQIVTGVVEPATPASRNAMDQIGRLDSITTMLSPLRSLRNPMERVYAYVENPAFGEHGSHAAGELHGAVKLDLYRDGFVVTVANMSSARGLLLGHAPAKGRAKIEIVAAWKAAGAPFAPDNDLCDAMTCANWGLSELGGDCFASVSDK
jgi:hypothetical protein